MGTNSQLDRDGVARLGGHRVWRERQCAVRACLHEDLGGERGGGDEESSDGGGETHLGLDSIGGG